MVYTLKVYKLPLGTPQSRGRSMVNLLPLQEGETITTTMAMPEDESTWDEVFVMFATSAGTVRRNRLSDFVRVQANGKIAMKLEEGAHLVSVQVCAEDQDVLLATSAGKCVRFAGGRRPGLRWAHFGGCPRHQARPETTDVISMSILNHIEVDVPRSATATSCKRPRRGPALRGRAAAEAERWTRRGRQELAEKEEFILSIADRRPRQADLRLRVPDHRARRQRHRQPGPQPRPQGQARPGSWAPSRSPSDDQIMLVSDGGQIIRVGVQDISLQRRATRGVRIFHVSDDERVVSVTRLEDENGNGENGHGEDTGGENGQQRRSGGRRGRDRADRRRSE